MKYYVVVKGKKPGIYLTWEECKKQVDGYNGAKFKSFVTIEDAEFYYMMNSKGKLPKKHFTNGALQEKINRSGEYKNVDLCVLCEKPFKQKLGKNYTRRNSPLCPSCKKKLHESSLWKNIRKSTNGYIDYLTANELIWIKKNNKCTDVFDFIIKNPDITLKAKNKANNNLAEKELKASRRSDYNIKNNKELPYVKQLLGEDKEFIRISGDKRNPEITYRCKRCNGDFKSHFNSMKKHKGHDCSALISSGESIIKEYLDKLGIKYLTQRNTLKCINPDTGFVMPYDFELPEYKIIIEVQGEQHRQFTEWFHVDEAGFEYQKHKDIYKKHFAESKGYQVIEIWYSDFDKGNYKMILDRLLE